MRVRVYVTLKPSVFDPQGKTVTDALHSLGYSRINEVRQGKFFELDVDAPTPEEAAALATQAAGTVLANPVIESFRVEVDASTAAAAGVPS
jgi:phosphoribosylformylglycinamidine synthase PurS subunit